MTKGGNRNQMCMLCCAHWKDNYAKIRAHFMKIPKNGVEFCIGPTDKLLSTKGTRKDWRFRAKEENPVSKDNSKGEPMPFDAKDFGDEHVHSKSSKSLPRSSHKRG